MSNMTELSEMLHPRYRHLLEIDSWSELRECLREFTELTKNKKFDCVFTEAVVRLGQKDELEPKEKELLERIIRLLIPWRKGPFELCGNLVDAEWRSDLKWARFSKHLGDLTGKKVADIGCNNGYYMYRLLEFDPESVLGVDPSDRFWFTFHFLNSIAKQENLRFALMGLEELAVSCRSCFDLILCLGVLYHRRDPLASLSKLRHLLRPSGTLFLETLCLEGTGSQAFFVADRYMKSRNVYFLPTIDCLCAWLEKSGFKGLELISKHYIGFEEQRKTVFSPYDSLSDFLSPEDSSRTVEGEPTAFRAIIKAQ